MIDTHWLVQKQFRSSVVEVVDDAPARGQGERNALMGSVEQVPRTG